MYSDLISSISRILLIGLPGSLKSVLSPWIAIFLFALIGGLGAAWLCYARPRWIPCFLLVFMPFENLVIKYIPGPNETYVLANFISEILIYMTVGFVLIRKVWSGKPLRRTPIDLFFLLFLLTAFLSIWVNDSPLFGGFVNIRVLVRYIFLYYLVSDLDFSPDQVSRLLRAIVILGVVEIFIGLLQPIVGEPLDQILLPRRMKFNISGISREFVLVTRGREIGAIFGTLGDTLFFALFMLIVLTAYLSAIEQLKVTHFIFFGIIFLAVNLTYARAVAFAILLMLLLFYHARYGFSRLPRWLFPALLLPVLLLVIIINATNKEAGYVNPATDETTILENLTDIFTEDYIRLAQKQRLGDLLGIPPTVLANRPILGYGPDQATTIKKLNASSPSYLLKTLNRRGFEDVYWVVILAYYGVIGVILWGLIFLSLYRFARRIYLTSKEKVTRGLAVTISCFVVVSVILLFFYRILEFRIFSFYFWFLAGLLVNLNSHELVLTQESQNV